ncbi:hypothetical protein F5146DRAFT_1001834 [Armillaria mellea]|nr:hypothetical protein F5146DRAFT_1001834 [Armillaria mellea]
MPYQLLPNHLAYEDPRIEAVSSAPYVEPNVTQAGLHVDFHLDYNIDPDTEALVWEVIREAKRIGGWISTNDRWQELKEAIGELPITLVGPPNFDMYMQDRRDTDKPLGLLRSALRIPYVARKYDLQIAMSVNNIENAFTLRGSVDPLALYPRRYALPVYHS